MKILPIILPVLITLPVSAQWTPPPDPNPTEILQEARADRAARRYEDALAKHVWYHRNALKHQRSLTGVRLSFALSYWHKLGEAYPPALTKLKEIRDEAVKNVKEGKDVRDSFSDLRAINRKLSNDEQTKDVFVWLDANDPELAKVVFGRAQEALIKAKAYELYGKYIDPKNAFPSILERFERSKRLAADPRFGARQMEFGQKKFSNDTATLIAILIINGRMAEAHKVAADARMQWDDESFHTAIDRALAGQVPDP